MQPEVLIPVPAVTKPVTRVRSTLIQSSINTLRKLDHFDRYLTLLDAGYREQLLASLAPEWLEVAVAHAHYSACDRLALSAGELHEIGELVGERIQGTFISMLLRNARTMGLSPWVPLGQFERLWERLMQGGAVGVSKMGPKDCTVEVRMLGLSRYQYFRIAFCGVISCAIKLGGGKAATVRVRSTKSFEERCIFTCAWV